MTVFVVVVSCFFLWYVSVCVASWSCPQHRCWSCDRTAGAAGGLLFRCVGCPAAYCEDCVPQDRIDLRKRKRVMSRSGC